MTAFVIDAPVAVKFAADGATIPPEHSLVAPTLLRSQALTLVTSRCDAASSTNRPPARSSTVSVDYVSGSWAIGYYRTALGE